MSNQPPLLPIHVAQSNFMELLAELEVFDSTEALKDPKIAAQIQVGLDKLCAAARPASPVTRTQEVIVRDVHLAHAAKVKTIFEGDETDSMKFVQVAAYFAQLEASQPQKGYDEHMDDIAEQQGLLSQSDEGIREALKAAAERCQKFLDTHGDFGNCVTQADIDDWWAALSRQAPVPTSGAVEAAAACQQVFMQNPRNPATWSPKVAAIIQQYGDAQFQVGHANEALSAQPPAADGKLRELLGKLHNAYDDLISALHDVESRNATSDRREYEKCSAALTVAKAEYEAALAQPASGGGDA